MQVKVYKIIEISIRKYKVKSGMCRAQHRTKDRVSSQNTMVPFARVSFLGYTFSSPLRGSPRGSISVSFKHKDISDVINVERHCFTHWQQFLGIQDVRGREKLYPENPECLLQVAL